MNNLLYYKPLMVFVFYLRSLVSMLCSNEGLLSDKESARARSMLQAVLAVMS